MTHVGLSLYMFMIGIEFRTPALFSVMAIVTTLLGTPLFELSRKKLGASALNAVPAL